MTIEEALKYEVIELAACSIDDCDAPVVGMLGLDDDIEHVCEAHAAELIALGMRDNREPEREYRAKLRARRASPLPRGIRPDGTIDFGGGDPPA